MTKIEFDDFFRAATRHTCFDYQRRLAESDGNGIAKSLLINVPTGLGKTAAVVMAWLWNVVRQRPCPRRLVYCLPMRTLVEQTRRDVATWLINLAKAYPGVEKIKWLAEHSPVILMGGEDDPQKNEWDIWPEKPCIVIGTQDMLLSRALNRGYGMSRYRWPMHFGLLNSDCLWVMDEVQLMGPGLWTSGQLDWMRQERFGTSMPCWTWWMSATNSGGFLETPDRGELRPSPFVFDENEMPLNLRDARRPCELWNVPAVSSARKGRVKKTSLTDAPPQNSFHAALAAAIVKDHQAGTLSLVVCNTVRMAQKLREEINSIDRGGAELILLTSRFRKRDRQANQDTLIAFERQRRSGATSTVPGLICVATQVVEAGVDVSACRLWSEVAPWPSVVQRLGRLNRDGLDNERARAFFFEESAAPGRGKGRTISGPYEAQALDRGRWLVGKLAEVCGKNPDMSAAKALGALRIDDQTADKVWEALEPALQPFPRAIDVHGLFSTEPDVFGGFTDVSPFVRGQDKNADVVVFWREFNANKPLSNEVLVGPAFDPAEACAVAIHRLREFIGKGAGFVWDDQQNVWGRFRTTEIFPGMVVMLPRSAGGYDASQGWTGQSRHCLDVVPPPGPLEEEFRADPFSERGEWVSLADHLADVRNVAAQIVTDLQLMEPHKKAVVNAAARHDVGKALDQWQAKLPLPVPDSHGKWAKSPFLFGVRFLNADPDLASVETRLSGGSVRFRRATRNPNQRSPDCYFWHTSKRVNDTPDRKALSDIRNLDGVKSAWMAPFRPGLRHEAASALGLWHEYFRDGADFPGLSIYLVAAHHGKVRTILTSRSKEGDDVCGVPKSVSSIPWNDGLALDFSCAADGAHGEFAPDGNSFLCVSPGWTGLIADLLGGWEEKPEHPTVIAVRDAAEPVHLGPFQLSYLETLLRCADMRASRQPSVHIDV